MSSDLIAAIQPKLLLSLVCALNMVPCWLLRRDTSGVPVRMLNQATILFGIGLPLLLFKDYLPKGPVVIVGNMMILAALGLLWQVVSWLNGRVVDRRLVMLAPLAWLLCWPIPAFREQLELRMAISAGLAGTLVILAMIDILRAGASDLPRRLLVATAGLNVVISTVRAALAASHSPVSASPVWIMVTQLDTLAYMMLWPALCTVLLNQRSLESEAERGRRDELSGLLNRRGMLLALGKASGGALLLFDIDRFKRINDRFGHAAGDAAIVAFARLAEQVLGPMVTLGRIGGEEFVALVPARDLPEARAIADRVRSGFASLGLSTGTGSTVTATVSIGIAERRPGEAVEMWLARADRALYRAKRFGRDRIELCTGKAPENETSEEAEEPTADADADHLHIAVPSVMLPAAAMPTDLAVA